MEQNGSPRGIEGRASGDAAYRLAAYSTPTPAHDDTLLTPGEPRKGSNVGKSGQYLGPSHPVGTGHLTGHLTVYAARPFGGV